MKTYQLNTFNDLLKIPADRRAACFRDLEYALSLHELVYGDFQPESEFRLEWWKDDGTHNVTLHDQHGNELPALEVTEK